LCKLLLKISLNFHATAKTIFPHRTQKILNLIHRNATHVNYLKPFKE
jgi:hypothetical protein